MSETTISESLFEQFCDSNSIPYHRVAISFTDGNKTPDYDVFFGGQKVVTEVKQIDSNQKDLQYLQELKTRGSLEWSGDSAARVRNKISDAMPQIRARARDEFPSLLVIYNNTPVHPYLTYPFSILMAMYGHESLMVTFPRDSEPVVAGVKFGGKRKVSRDYNTSLSAVAVMHKSEDSTVRLDVYHNIYARIIFDPNWLRVQAVNHYSLRKMESGRFQNWIEV